MFWLKVFLEQKHMVLFPGPARQKAAQLAQIHLVVYLSGTSMHMQMQTSTHARTSLDLSKCNPAIIGWSIAITHVDMFEYAVQLPIYDMWGWFMLTYHLKSFDISHLQSTSRIACIYVFHHALPSPKRCQCCSSSTGTKHNKANPTA